MMTSARNPTNDQLVIDVHKDILIRKPQLGSAGFLLTTHSHFDLSIRCSVKPSLDN